MSRCCPVFRISAPPQNLAQFMMAASTELGLPLFDVAVMIAGGPGVCLKGVYLKGTTRCRLPLLDVAVMVTGGAGVCPLGVAVLRFVC